jgi:hypothetical protein
MSGLFGGSGSDVGDVKPGRAPKIPHRTDDKTQEMAMRRYRKFAKTDSVAAHLLYQSGKTAGAPAPSRSHTTQIFGEG